MQTPVKLSHRHAAVLHSDPFAPLLLEYLDVESIAALVVYLGERFGREACSVLQDDALWTRLLQERFASIKRTSSLSADTTQTQRFQGDQMKTCAPSAVKARNNNQRHESQLCGALVQFHAFSRERRWFEQHVVIIRSDSESIDLASDPSSFDEVVSDTYLRKNGVRAMSGDFAWSSESDTESEVSVHPLDRGSSRNGFILRGRTTRMRSLIHVVSPRSFLQSPWKVVSRTFAQAMEAIQHDELRNVAVHAPCPSARTADRIALTDLRDIQRFITQEAWKGTVGIVCYEKETFQAFKAQKERVLASFGAAL